ncbi:hypothetical protein [Blastococcus capsensis]|uniref:hypothetical protein n=1 Tax=Blastococcus capsensis TaxID=1564163 RepID=UPI00254188B5|nr:hypothetical protein [Blastococcus capsensis]MDK3258290.1 hypothetical protein [Blastococcus capsensis]
MIDTVALDPHRNVPGVRRPGFAQTLRAEWIKSWSVRSTVWSIVALVVLGAGLTVLVCAVSADDLAGEAAGSFITWGMTIARTCSSPGPVSRCSAPRWRQCCWPATWCCDAATRDAPPPCTCAPAPLDRGSTGQV